MISDEEPMEKKKSPHFSEEEDEKVNEINTTIEQLTSNVPVQLHIQPLVEKVAIPPMYNPEPE